MSKAGSRLYLVPAVDALREADQSKVESERRLDLRGVKLDSHAFALNSNFNGIARMSESRTGEERSHRSRK